MVELTDNLRDAANAAVKNNKSFIDAHLDEDPVMDTDNCLMQPVDNWDKIDRKGHWGDNFLSYPSKAYRANYDNIDWTK